jgi:uncharacterized protein YqgC (DUF456 family)
MIVLYLLLLVLLHIAVIGGLFAVVLGLSGNFILLGLALLVAWIGHFEHLTPVGWLALLGFAILGEVVETFLGVAAARRFGASRWGMIGTFLGGILGAAVGTAWIPLLGTLVGALVGAFAGAFAGELLKGQGTGPSAKAGTGAFVGRVAASAFKLAIGILIAYWTLRAAYPLV